MNLNNFFDINHKEVPPIESSTVDYKTYKNIEMFSKIIHNYEKYGMDIIKIMQSSDTDLGITKATAKHLAYEKAFLYLSNIELETDAQICTLYQLINQKLLNAIILSLSYYEKLEEYEKCSIILNYKTVIENYFKINLEIKNKSRIL